MKTNRNSCSPAVPAAVLSLLCACSLTAKADVLTWTGGSGTSANWSDSLNWNNSAAAAAVPTAGDNLIFSGYSQMANTDDLSGLSGGWLKFANGDFWLNGTNGLTLSGLTNVAGNNILFMPLTLGTAQVWDRAIGSSVTVSNTLALGANALTLSNDGDTTLAGVLSGSGLITQNGGGTLTLVGANTNSGGLTVNAGTVNGITGNGTAYGGIGTGSLVVNGGTVNMNGDNALFGQGTTLAPPRSVTINSGGTVATGDRSGHLPSVILNGGILSASTARGDYGNWNLDYGVLTLTNGSVSTIQGGSVTLGQTGGTVFNIGAGDTVNVSSVIAHTSYATDLGLIKTGAGVLSLSAANTYTSTTTIRGGTLALSWGSIDRSPLILVSTNGTLDVTGIGYSVATNQTLAGVGTVVGAVNDNNAGAVVSPGGANAAGTLSFDTLILNGNLALNYDLANVTTAGSYVNDMLVVTNLTLASGITNVVNFNFLNATPQVGGVYTLIKYTTCNSPAGVVYTLASAPTRYTFTFTNDTSANAIKVIVGGNPAVIVWKGDSLSNVWDVVTTPNWLKNGSTPDVFYQADNVTFNDSGSSTPPVNLAAAVLPTTVTVNSTNTYMFTGPGKLSGSTTLTKSGNGTLILNTVNDFTGLTTVNGGTLNLQVASAVPGPVALNAGAINVNAGSGLTGQATLNGGTLTINATSGATGATNTVNSGANLVLTAGGSSGCVQNTLNVNAGGTNTLLAGNAYGYSGTAWLRTLNINGGLVDSEVSGDNGWGLTINLTGGELRSFNGVSSSGAGPLYSLGGGSAINVLASSTPAVASGRLNLREGNPGNLVPVTVADGTADPDFLVTAAITSSSASYGWSKNGPGTMTLAGANTYNSPTVINAGTLRVGAGGTLGSVGTGFVTNNAMLIFNRSDALTVSGAISGTGTVQNVGTGALLLNGTNTYTGATTISAGTLQGSGFIDSPITVQSGANFSAGGVLAAGTLTTSNLTVSPGAGMVFDLSSTTNNCDLLAARGTLTLDAATPVTFNFLGGTPYTGGPYTIVTNWVPRSGALSYINPTRYAVNLDNSQANCIQVSFSGANANLVWQGNVNNLWNINGDANWLSSGAPAKYFQSDVVIFDDAGSRAPNVNLASDMTPAGVTVNSSANYNLSGGAIGGLGALTKSGSGTLTLLNAVTSTGTTTLSGGTLQIGNAGTTGSIAGNIADFSSVVFKRSDSLSYGGVISGPGTLTQAGTGTLLLTGNHTFSGGTTVNAGGTVQVGNGALLDSGVLGLGLVNNLGSIIYNRASQITVSAPHTGSGSLTFLGTGALGQSSYSLNATNTFTGPVTLLLARLTGNLGSLSLGNPASITVQQGAQVYAVGTAYSPMFNIPLTLSGTGWRESSGLLGALRLNGGANWAGPLTLAGNSRITAYNDGNSNVVSGTITGGSYQLETGASGGTSALLYLAPSAANSFGSLLVSPGTLVLGNARAVPSTVPLWMNGGTIQLNGNSLTPADFFAPGGGSIQNGSSTTPVTLTLNPSTDVTYSGTFTNGGTQPLSLIKNGNSRLTLSGRDAATGGVTVNGGSLALSSGGGNGCLVGNVTMQPGTLLLSMAGDSFGYNGGLSQVTNLNLNGATLLHTPNNNLTFWNNLAINLTGASMAATNVGGSARLDLGTGAYVNSLASANSSTIAGANLYLRQTESVFNVADGAAADDLVISAPINQSATGYGITKNGAGRLKITGAVGFSGALTINGGSVVLGASSPLTTVAGPITVAAGATLDVSAPGGLTLNANQVLQGAGTVTGNVTDTYGTVIRIGNSMGTLTVNGALTLGGSGSLAMKLSNVTTVGGGVNDLIQINGDLSLQDALPTSVAFSFPNGLPAAGTYTIMRYTGNLSGSAAGLTNNAGGSFSIDTLNKAVRVTFTVPAQNLVWQGGDFTDNSWDLATATTNWSNGTVLTNFYQLDTVRFDDAAGAANTIVNITAGVMPASITVDSTNNYTFTGAGKLTGATRLTKNNSNTVTLGTANDFTGPVTVNAGVLASGAATGLPDGAAVTVANGAAFVYMANPNSSTRNYSFSIAGAGPDGNGAIQNNQGADIYQNSSISNLTLTADAAIGGANRWDVGSGATGVVFQANGFTLTKVSTNQITFRPETILNATNFVISGGILQHESFNRTNTSTLTTTNIVNANGTLSSWGTLTFNYPVLFNGGSLANPSGTATWTGPMTLAANTPVTAANPVNLFGPISGPGGFLKTGSGVLTLSNANTYAGGTVLSNAPVTLTNAAASGTASIVVANASALGSGAVTLNPVLVTANTLTNVVRALEFNLGGGSNVVNAINLPPSSSLVTNLSIQGRDSTSVFTLGGQISGGYVGLTNWFDCGVANNFSVTRLANTANNFVASSIRVARGNLAITGDGCLGNSANVLRLDQAAGGITGPGLRFDAPNITLAHNVLVASGTVFDMFGDNNGDGVADTVNNVTVGGVLSGGGTIYVRGTNGTLTLSGANTYTGGFELQQPVTLQVGASNNLGTAYIAIKAGSTFRYTGSGSETMTRTLYMDNSGGGTIDVPNASAWLTWLVNAGGLSQNLAKTGSGALTLGGSTGISGGVLSLNGGALTVNSVISGSTVVQANSGVLTLAATNTYVGPTTVGGSASLFVNGVLPAANSVAVNVGGTLGGNGTINCPVTVAAGGKIEPGVSAIGKLTVNSTLNLAGTTTMEINGTTGTNDAVVGLSTVSYGGTLNVSNLGGTPASGAKFTLFSAMDRVGTFGAVNLPALPAGMVWANLLSVDGSIQAVPMTATLTNVVVGHNLQLSWPADSAWRLLAMTNAAGITGTNWYPVPTSGNAITIPIDVRQPAVFYRLVYP